MTDASPSQARPSPSTAWDRRERQLRDLRFLETLQAALTGCGSEQAVYSAAVHRVASVFEAEAACIATYEAITDELEIVHQTQSRLEPTEPGRPRSMPQWDLDAIRQAALEQHIVTADSMMAAPVLTDGAVWGVLALRRVRTGVADRFTSQDRQTLRGAADRIGHEAARRRQDLVDDVLDDLLRKTKPIDVYTHALRELRRFVRYDHAASVMTMQRGVAQMTVRVEKVVRARGDAETLLDGPRRGRVLRLTTAQSRYLGRLKVPLVLTNDGTGWLPGTYSGGPHPDAAGLWRVFRPQNLSQGSILCYPLIFGGQTLGFLCLAATRSGAFAAGTPAFGAQGHVLGRFARLLSVTLYRSELYYQSDRQLQAIKEIGRAVTLPLPVEEVCEQVLHLALRVLHVQVGAVGLIGDDGALELVAHHGSTLAEMPRLAVGEGIAGTVVQTGQPRAVRSVRAEPDYVEFNSRVRSELIVSIAYNREVIGFLDVESYEEGRFREEDEEVITFLEALANQAAIAIKTAQLRREAMKLLGASVPIDPKLSTAGFQDLIVEELRATIDRLAAANRAKSDFLAHMSHDLRGPLNVIVGLSNLLADPAVAGKLDPEKQRESLQLIRSNGEVLGALIGNILDLSAVEAGKTHLTAVPFDAASAFTYLCAVANTLAAEAHKDLDVSFTADPRIEQIVADEEKFLRIMHNLISNAVKFTPSGGRIEMRASFADERLAREAWAHDAKPALHVTVSDTGIGVAPEHHAQIFQPFQQLGGDAYRRQHGTGLGLTVVRELVTLHGGRVWIESTAGAGSIFHVVLPEALPTTPPNRGDGDEAVEACSVPGTAEPAAMERERGSVLVVEDIPAHMNVMRLAVTSRGFTMHGVTSGEEALEWLGSHRPDVILLDMELPGADGFTTAARIKERVETHAIPIIAVTANALTVSEDRARASGCDAYLTKPIDIAALVATLDAAVKQEL